MSDRFPLILNTSTNQIQEIASGDTLDLTGNNIKGVGIITATTISGTLSGIATLARGLTDIPSINVTNITGVGATFSGAIDANGDLDVDGHTNLDNVSIAGVTTFSDDVVVNFGTGNDLQIYHTSSTNRSYIKEVGSGGFYLQAANLNVMNLSLIHI